MISFFFFFFFSFSELLSRQSRFALLLLLFFSSFSFFLFFFYRLPSFLLFPPLFVSSFLFFLNFLRFSFFLSCFLSFFLSCASVLDTECPRDTVHPQRSPGLRRYCGESSLCRHQLCRSICGGFTQCTFAFILTAAIIIHEKVRLTTRPKASLDTVLCCGHFFFSFPTRSTKEMSLKGCCYRCCLYLEFEKRSCTQQY